MSKQALTIEAKAAAYDALVALAAEHMTVFVNCFGYGKADEDWYVSVSDGTTSGGGPTLAAASFAAKARDGEAG